MKFNLFFIVSLLFVNFAHSGGFLVEKKVNKDAFFGFIDIKKNPINWDSTDHTHTCLHFLEIINSQSKAPLEFLSNSSDLIVQREGNVTHFYRKDGMVEMNGTNCKSVDKNIKIDSGLIEILQNAVSHSKIQFEKEPEEKKKWTSNLISALISCGKISPKLSEYSNKILIRELGILGDSARENKKESSPAKNPSTTK